MAKELLLYSPFYSFSAERLIGEIESNKNNDITLRVNSPGGSVFSGWGMIAKIKEHGNVTMQVDGMAASMAAFALTFAKKTKALKVSKLLLHRADGYVSNEADQKFLNDINADLRTRFEQKVNADKFQEVTGYTIDQMFDSSQRIDIYVNADQAKEIGLIDEVIDIDSSTVEASKMFDFAAMFKTNTTAQKPKNQTPKKDTKMNIEKLKAEHPDVYAQVLKIGSTQERERVEAWSEYMDIDAEGVKAGIESGKNPSAKDFARFNRKYMEAKALENLENDSADDTDKDANDKKDKGEPSASEKFEAEMKKELDLK